MPGLMYLDRPVDDLTSVQRVLSGRDLFYHITTIDRRVEMRHKPRLLASHRVNMWTLDEMDINDFRLNDIVNKVPTKERPRGVKLVVDPFVSAKIAAPSYGQPQRVFHHSYGSQLPETSNREVNQIAGGLAQVNKMLEPPVEPPPARKRSRRYVVDVPRPEPMSMETLDRLAFARQGANEALDVGDYALARDYLTMAGIEVQESLWADGPSASEWVRVSVDPSARVLSWGEQGLSILGTPRVAPPWWSDLRRISGAIDTYTDPDASMPWKAEEYGHATIISVSVRDRFLLLAEWYAARAGYQAIAVPTVGVWALDPSIVRVEALPEYDWDKPLDVKRQEEYAEMAYRGRVAAALAAGRVTNPDVAIECGLGQVSLDRAAGERAGRAIRLLLASFDTIEAPSDRRTKAKALLGVVVCVQSLCSSLAALGRSLGLRHGRVFARMLQALAVVPAPGADVVGRVRPLGMEDWTDAEAEVALIWEENEARFGISTERAVELGRHAASRLAEPLALLESALRSGDRLRTASALTELTKYMYLLLAWEVPFWRPWIKALIASRWTLWAS